MLSTTWSSDLGEGAKEKERLNIVATVRSSWESTTPLQLQRAWMLRGVPSSQRGAQCGITLTPQG